MKKIYFFIIGLIFLLSFLLYASLFYPLLNSDNAVTILMIHYFQLPNDLYFWGQDRMGSLIPLLGQIPFKLFNLSALTSESVIHYLILLLGFLSFTHFLKSYFLKIIFAIVWFFPPMRLIDVTQFSFGIHYSLIALSCYLLEYYQRETTQKNQLLRHSILILIILLLTASIWVSDMALISVFLLLGIQLYVYFQKNNFSLNWFRKTEFYYAVLGITVGCLFIYYAKSTAPNRQDYTTFSDLNTIKQTFLIFGDSILEFLKFESDEPFTNIYAYLVILILVLLSTQLKSIRLNSTSKQWALFFLFDAILLLGIILISNWTFLNGVPRRYFTCTYISLSFSLLLLLDNLSSNQKKTRTLYALLLATVLIGGLGTLYNLNYVSPKSMTPRVELSKEFDKLGSIGLLSEYWNSYITSCHNPDLIKATPHSTTGGVRNYEMVEKVFEQKNIYVIKDMWLQNFPDTLNEFGRTLVKDGSEFSIGGCNVCKYKISPSP